MTLSVYVTHSAKQTQSCSNVNTPQLSTLVFSSFSSLVYHLLIFYLLHARLSTHLF